MNTNIYYKKEAHLPDKFIWLVIYLCILPTVLNAFGVDYSSTSKYIPDQSNIIIDLQIFTNVFKSTIAGNFILTILEWSAFWIAMFTVILAFTNFKITGDVTTPIIGTVLFCAGCMDGFHTLIAYNFMNGIEKNVNLIPLTWAISQLFYGLLLLLTISLFLAKDKRENKWEQEKGFSFALIISSFFFLIAYVIIHLIITSPHLPETMFPYSVVSRPWDIGPLLIFLFIGLYTIPIFYNRHPSLFSHALLVSIIPLIMSQLHMIFGSTTLFDNHFNIAHFLKVISYSIPFCGLVMDYHRTYREIEDLNQQLVNEIANRKEAEKKLEWQTSELRRSNEELQQFAYIASHDLQEPLRMVASYTQLLKKRYKDKLDPDANEFIDYAFKGALRMQDLINDLLSYSRVNTKSKKFEKTNLDNSFKKALENIKIALVESNAEITCDALPTLMADEWQLNQLFQNLISNAVKYKGLNTPKIHVSSSFLEDENMWRIDVSDNGIGIDPKYKEKIFLIFQRLHTKEEYPGTGIGLAICKKIVERHGGNIWVESEIDKGSRFSFTLKNE